MNMIFWFRYGLLLLVVFASLNIRAQNPTYQLTVESGGYTDFKIYSLSQYEDGMSLTNWTRLKIVYKDTTSGTQVDRWYLAFKANTTAFEGDIPSRTLPLDYVSLYVQSTGTEDLSSTATFYEGPHEISDEFVSLVEEGDEGIFRMSITYQLDAPLGHSPDYYLTQLIFKMDTVPIL
jgi:hypothetical protein